MFASPHDRSLVEQELQALNVHPGETDRLASFGDAAETFGSELLAAIISGELASWLQADNEDPKTCCTDPGDSKAIGLESAVAAGIGATGASTYRRLFIGGTLTDAPSDADVIHVNCIPEDMRFASQGPRILIDGKRVPVRDDIFQRAEGYHIPYDRALTADLLADVFRTMQRGGILEYAPSSNAADVEKILLQIGFQSVQRGPLAKATTYNGRPTPIAVLIRATRP